MAILFENGNSIVSTESNSILNLTGITKTPIAELPSFSVAKNNGGNPYTSVGIITWNDIIFNNGNHFDGQKFTAPIAGKYWFYVWFMSSNAAVYNNRTYEIRVNDISGDANTSARNYNSSTTAHYKQLCGGALFDLNVGDYVNVSNVNSALYAAASVYVRFSGALIL